jgi:hypothetical protein
MRVERRARSRPAKFIRRLNFVGRGIRAALPLVV